MSDKSLGLRCAPQAPCCEEGFIFMDVDSKEDKEAQLMGYDIGLRETPNAFMPPSAPLHTYTTSRRAWGAGS